MVLVCQFLIQLQIDVIQERYRYGSHVLYVLIVLDIWSISSLTFS